MKLDDVGPSSPDNSPISSPNPSVFHGNGANPHNNSIKMKKMKLARDEQCVQQEAEEG